MLFFVPALCKMRGCLLAELAFQLDEVFLWFLVKTHLCSTHYESHQPQQAPTALTTFWSRRAAEIRRKLSKLSLMPSEPSTVVFPEVLWLNTVTPTTFNSAPSNEHRSMIAVRAQHYSTKKREAQGALLLELQRHGEHLLPVVSPAPFGVLGPVSTLKTVTFYKNWSC